MEESGKRRLFPRMFFGFQSCNSPAVPILCSFVCACTCLLNPGLHSSAACSSQGRHGDVGLRSWLSSWSSRLLASSAGSQLTGLLRTRKQKCSVSSTMNNQLKSEFLQGLATRQLSQIDGSQTPFGFSTGVECSAHVNKSFRHHQ